jgi:ribonuclease HI
MELLACIKALEWVRKNAPWRGVNRVQIVTDSIYVRENLGRARGWQKDDWRNLHGEVKENPDLWKQLLSARTKTGIRVDVHWQPGKTSHMSKMVDKAAKAAAKRGGAERDSGYRRGKVAPSKLRESATIFPAQGQTAVIRIYRKDGPLKGVNKIRFNLFAEDLRMYIASHYAYATDSLTAEFHRQHSYRVRFNCNRRNPVIEEIIEEVSPVASEQA